MLCLLSLSGGRLAQAEEAFRILLPPGHAAHPAVLFVPGCSGFAASKDASHYDQRAAALQAAGYAVVFVDYVGRRMQTNCAHVLLNEVAADILEAATWARSLPEIDASRISVIGWSYGAGGVLAALKSMPPDPAFAKAVMYYPVCRGAAPWSANVAGLMLLGESDDVAYPALCKPVIDGMPSDRLRVITYPAAHHGFDVQRTADRADPLPGAPAYSAAAAQASWSAVLEFLQ